MLLRILPVILLTSILFFSCKKSDVVVDNSNSTNSTSNNNVYNVNKATLLQLVNDVRTSAGTPIGKVRIGSLPSTAHPLVSTLYKRLKERYPLVQLAVREGQGSQLETWLEDGSVDLA